MTARSGLILYAEFMRGIGVEALIEWHMPKHCSERGIEPIRYIKSLPMTPYEGRKAIEDVLEIREDESVGEAL